MKLNQFIKNKRLQKKIDEVVMDANVLLGEGYLFANFHLLRLLDARKEVPKIDRNYYYRCLLAVQRKNTNVNIMGADMMASLVEFDRLRPEGDIPPPVEMDNIAMYDKMTKAQLTNESKARRLKKYSNLNVDALRTLVKEKFGTTSPLTMKASDFKPDSSKLLQLLGDLSISMATMACNHLWMNLESRLTSYVKRRYPNLKGKWKRVVDAVVNFPQRNLDEMFNRQVGNQRTIEAKALAVRLRSVLPLPSHHHYASRAHLTIPLYYEILKYTEEVVNVARDAPSNKRESRLRTFTMLPIKSKFTISHVPISNMMFMTMLKWTGLETFDGDGRYEDKYTMWSKYFNLNAVETRNRHFGFRINTDGCAVSVVMDKLSCIAGCKAHRSIDNLMDKIRNHEIKASDLEVVGGDPGFTDIITKTTLNGEVGSFSSTEYYERALFNLSKRRTDSWNEETKELTDRLSTPKTAEVDTLKAYIGTFLSVHHELLEHRAKKGYRNMRFLRFCKRNELIEEICDFIAPEGKPTVVGFGNWKPGNKSPISRRTCGPLEDIKRALDKRAHVYLVLIDEFRTSIMCHRCHCRLSNMKAFTTRTKNGEKTTTTVPVKVHKVLHCRTSESGANCCKTTWNRDVNGSKNMLMKTMLHLYGWELPTAFVRSKQPVQTS